MSKLWGMFFNKEFMLFVIIGGINTINGTVFASVYSMLFQANIAFVLGYITALTIAFFLNTFFIFRTKLQAARFIKFIVSYVPNFIVQNVLVLILYNGLMWNKLLVYAIAAAVGIPATFLILKLYAFKSA